jgi:murein DD-endopeptidase MepM/ murein hydrolase activator NlpD
MSGRTVLAAAAVSGTILCCGGLILAPLATAFTETATTTAKLASTTCGQPGTTLAAAKTGTVPGYAADQVANATAIVQTGQRMNVPPRGWVVAVATAMQESDLHNSAVATDHDSVGLFQQRPSQGWGTITQIMDPAYGARAFYTALLKISGWQSQPVTVAAQAVQRSAFPGAYAKHEALAARLVDAITGGAAQTAATAPTAGTCAPPGQVTAAGWVAPAKGPVISGFRTPDRPTHNGVDIAIPKHTPIVAAAAGTVIKALCDPATAAVRSCDLDGDPSVPGCGWYVDISHADQVITRYCHQLVRPLVVAGQTVAAGQQIGWSGTSGNSSGPHLHFEVHLRSDPAASGAVDPIGFMRDHGASLGNRS